jgi:hypothetical protein
MGSKSVSSIPPSVNNVSELGLAMTSETILDNGPTSRMVFFVDITYSDGTDGAPHFIPFLLDIGATVVESWSSNTIGVTHVLGMNPSLLTMEKVVASKGAVIPVNICWAAE